jgi:hypothetical protein
MANDIFRLLQIATKGTHIVEDNIPTKVSDRIDPFENKKNGENIVIMKTKFILRGYGGKVRRAYVKCPNALDYRYVGWVFDDDVQNCMICGVDFSFLLRRHHCRVCGNIICSSCSTGTVRIKELPDCERVRACDSCYIGQEEISIKPENPLPLQFPQFNPPSNPSNEQCEINPSRTQRNRRNSSVGNNRPDGIATLQKQVYRYQVAVLVVYVILYVIVLQINK